MKIGIGPCNWSFFSSTTFVLYRSSLHPLFTLFKSGYSELMFFLWDVTHTAVCVCVIRDRGPTWANRNVTPCHCAIPPVLPLWPWPQPDSCQRQESKWFALSAPINLSNNWLSCWWHIISANAMQRSAVFVCFSSWKKQWKSGLPHDERRREEEEEEDHGFNRRENLNLMSDLAAAIFFFKSVTQQPAAPLSRSTQVSASSGYFTPQKQFIRS